jgi:hypothetical protein
MHQPRIRSFRKFASCRICIKMDAGRSQDMTESEIETLLPLWRDRPAAGRPGDWWDKRDSAEDHLRQARELRDRPDLGWESAKLIVSKGGRAAPAGASFWVVHAVRLLAGEEKKERLTSVVRDSLTIRSNPEMARALEAALLATDASAGAIASAFQIPEMVVNAYSSLFFNILDRKWDRIYAAGMIRFRYPPSSLNLPTSASSPRKLLEVGLHGKLEDVLAVAGIQQGSILKLLELAAEGAMREQVGVSTSSTPAQKINPAMMRSIVERIEAQELEVEQASRGPGIGALMRAQLDRDADLIRQRADAEAEDFMKESQPP